MEKELKEIKDGMYNETINDLENLIGILKERNDKKLKKAIGNVYVSIKGIMYLNKIKDKDIVFEMRS